MPQIRNRAKHTGKGRQESFLSLPHFILNSNEFAELTGNELRMLLELARQYKGNNNGDMTAMRDQLRKRGWNSHQTIDVVLANLENKGWIVKTRQGGKRRGCTLYGLTIWAIDSCGDKHEWTPEYKASHRWKDKTTGPIPIGSRPGYQA
jgi:hypothetical protein